MANSMIKGSTLMKRSFVLVVLSLLSLSALVGGVTNKSKDGAGLYKSADPVVWSKKALQGFSMKMWMNNQLAMGIEAWGGSGSDVPDSEHCGIGIGCVYPSGSGSCVEHLFGAGPIIGGIINGTAYVSEAYNTESAGQEFVPATKD